MGYIGGGGPGGDDDDGTGGAICGDTVKEGSEACDDGNTTGGDGCSATCQVEVSPKMTTTIDKVNVDTELFTTNMVTLTLKSEGGLAGSIALTAKVVDATDVAIPGWEATIPATVDLPADGQQTVVASLKVPSSTAALSGTLKIEATSSAGTERIQSTVTVQKQITFAVNFNAGANQCVYPAGAVGTVNVAQGTKVRLLNNDATANMIFHIGDGGAEIDGLTHQGDAGTAPGTAYEQTVGSATGGTKWYCHNRNNPNNLGLNAVP